MSDECALCGRVPATALVSDDGIPYRVCAYCDFWVTVVPDKWDAQ